MTRILDRTNEESIAEAVLAALIDLDCSAEEAIPGLIVAIQEIAYHLDEKGYLAIEEAVDLLDNTHPDDEEFGQEGE